MTKLNEDKQELRNMMAALFVVVAALFGFEAMFSPNKKTMVEVPITPTVVEQNEQALKAVIDTQKEPSLSVDVAALPLENDFLSGMVNISSGGLEALSLTQYHETIAKDSPTVQLLSAGNYWSALEWTGNAQMPTAQDTWQSDNTKLTPFSPLRLTYANADIKIERVISMDEAYMFTVTDTLHNLKDKPITVGLNGKINRRVDEKSLSVSPVHEGFLSLIDGTLEEKDYSDVSDKAFSEKTTGGWLGFTDKYWQTVMIFDQSVSDVSVRFSRQGGLYTAAFDMPDETVAAGASLTRTTRLFAGAKKLDLINAYEKNLNIPKFDLSIDFGWFYFLTKPFLYFLNWLYGLVGNMGVAILIFATLLRIVMLPVATKSYESMAKMRKVQPRIKALQQRYKDNRMLLQQEMMNLYKREKINPAGGCLPILIQIPVFYALYKVLSVSINMRQAPFFGWIHDLSMPDPSSVFTLFGYMDWPIPSFLNIGVWPVLMGITMWIQQKMTAMPSADKTQANMFKMMPIIFTFMMGSFASGLVIYWTWSNVLSIAQQKYIMKKVGV